ncbi:site-specific integrase [Neptunomonas phycophila]|uniref:site-specific integrase n=2 Tax=Neptunomonas phycophila TaxID=1572645 RepID=UPI000948A1FB
MKTSPFLNTIRQSMRARGYSLRTEKTYIYWIKQYIVFHKLKHPSSMAAQEVTAFLSHLAIRLGTPLPLTYCNLAGTLERYKSY